MKNLLITALLAGCTLEAFGQATMTFPKNVLLDDGIAYYMNENYVAASQFFKAYITRHENETGLDLSEALYYKTASEIHLIKNADPEPLLKYLELYPATIHRAEAYLLLGSLYMDRGEFTRAQYYLNKISNEALSREQIIEAEVRQAYCLMKIPKSKRNPSGLLEMRKLLEDASVGTGKWSKKALIYLATLDLSEGKTDLVRQILDRVSFKGNLAYEAESLKGQLYCAEKKWDKAIEVIEPLWRSHPEMAQRPELLRAAGLSYYHLNDYPNAIKNLDEFIAKAKPEVEASVACADGIAHYKIRDFKGAEEPLQIAVVQQNEVAAVASLYLGQARYELGSYHTAAMAFESVINNPDAPSQVRESAMYNMAISLRMSGTSSFGQAVHVAERFFAEYPNSQYREEMAALLVESYYTGKDFDASLRSINQIKYPTNSILQAKQYVLTRLGALEMNRHRWAEAESYFTQALSINTKGDFAAEALLSRAKVRYEQQRYELASQDAKLYASRYGQHSSANFSTARYINGYSLFNMKRYKEAYSAFNDYLSTRELAPSQISEAKCRMGDCLYAQKRFNEAVSSYNQAYRAYPKGSEEALVRMADIYGYLGRYKDQIDIVDRYVSSFPQGDRTAEMLYTKGRAAMLSNMPAKVIENAFAGVVEKYPDSRWARQAGIELAMIYYQRSDAERAISTYKQIIERYPQSDEARTALSDLKSIYLAMDRVEDFTDYASRFGSSYLDDMQADKLLFEQAENRYRAKASNAQSGLEDYLRKYPNSVDALKAKLYLAEIYNQKGLVDRAKTLYQELTDSHITPEIRAKAQVCLARIYESEKRYSDAYKMYSEAYKLAETSAYREVYGLGAVKNAYLCGQYRIAYQTASEVLSKDRLNNDELVLWQGKALYKDGHMADALKVLRPLSANFDTEVGAESLVTMAQIKYDVEDLANAKKLCLDFIRKSTPQQYWLARGFILLSDIYRKEGDHATAKQYLLSLEQNYPADNKDNIIEMINERLNNL